MSEAHEQEPLRWSNHHKYRGTHGRPKGYQDQAFEVALNPHQFLDVDLQKAANVLRHNKLVGYAEKCEREIAIRREVSKSSS